MKKERSHVDWEISAAEKGGYEHFMFKEIMEQPKALRDTIFPRLRGDRVVLDDLTITREELERMDSTVNETDAQGGTRQSNEASKSESSLYTKDGSGNDVPWVIKEMEPEIEGVLVAAEGGDNENVANEITQAVQVLFNIPVHKIKVVKMKGE